MNPTPEQLNFIEEYASCFMTWKQIAVLLDINPSEFRNLISDHNSEAYKRYTKGKTKSIFEINKGLVRLAKLGSPQAETLIRTDIIRQEEAEDEL